MAATTEAVEEVTTERDFLHETGLCLDLNQDPQEDWGETFPEDED